MSGIYRVKPYEHAWAVRCPATGNEIVIPKDGRWSFNGNWERPTFSPSVHEKWQMPASDEGDPPGPWQINHTIINDGRIQYCGDCTHAMAGQTVEIPPLSEAMVAMYFPAERTE